MSTPSGLCVEFNPTTDEVHIHYGWLGHIKPRIPAPPMPAELLPIADAMARAALSAAPGELTREHVGCVFTYSRPQQVVRV